MYNYLKLISFLIGGITIHQAFGFNWTDGYKYEALADKKLAQLRFHLGELKVIIIDEVSLLNCDMLYRIHMRLCEIFQTKAPFGGRIVLLVGDIMQVNHICLCLFNSIDSLPDFILHS